MAKKYASSFEESESRAESEYEYNMRWIDTMDQALLNTGSQLITFPERGDVVVHDTEPPDGPMHVYRDRKRQ